jgi:hypothetical protein
MLSKKTGATHAVGTRRNAPIAPLSDEFDLFLSKSGETRRVDMNGKPSPAHLSRGSDLSLPPTATPFHTVPDVARPRCARFHPVSGISDHGERAGDAGDASGVLFLRGSAVNVGGLVAVVGDKVLVGAREAGEQQHGKDHGEEGVAWGWRCLLGGGAAQPRIRAEELAVRARNGGRVEVSRRIDASARGAVPVV